MGIVTVAATSTSGTTSPMSGRSVAVIVDTVTVTVASSRRTPTVSGRRRIAAFAARVAAVTGSADTAAARAAARAACSTARRSRATTTTCSTASRSRHTNGSASASSTVA